MVVSYFFREKKISWLYSAQSKLCFPQIKKAQFVAGALYNLVCES